MSSTVRLTRAALFLFVAGGSASLSEASPTRGAL